MSSKRGGAPFTYPEVQQIQNLAELMDNILTHARLTAEAALKARIEYLGMMSRGLAHDLKNLVTPISTFLVHTAPHIIPNSIESEVHTAANRAVTVMTEYFNEALFFGNRLTPNFETTALPPLLNAVADVTAARARRKGVTLEISPNDTPTAILDRVLAQRLLANLVHNAIDASPAGGTVLLSATSTPSKVLVFQVKDTGCGIAPEHRSRIFEPYFTTKEFGDEIRGFGLGLTICEKIARLHGGTIFVDSELGRGTTMRVELPPNPATPPAVPTATPETFSGSTRRTSLPFAVS